MSFLCLAHEARLRHVSRPPLPLSVITYRLLVIVHSGWLIQRASSEQVPSATRRIDQKVALLMFEAASDRPFAALRHREPLDRFGLEPPVTAPRFRSITTWRGCDMIDQWPLRSSLEFGALPSAAPCARLHVKHVLWEWGLSAQGDNAELAASELVTNAVQASRILKQETPVRLWLLASTAHVVVLVWDASPHPPVRIEKGVDAESGRGLLLVEAISGEWSWYFDQQGRGGKYVSWMVTSGARSWLRCLRWMPVLPVRLPIAMTATRPGRPE